MSQNVLLPEGKVIYLKILSVVHDRPQIQAKYKHIVDARPGPCNQVDPDQQGESDRNP